MQVTAITAVAQYIQ